MEPVSEAGWAAGHVTLTTGNEETEAPSACHSDKVTEPGFEPGALLPAPRFVPLTFSWL